jgi:hypothetical protein
VRSAFLFYKRWQFRDVCASSPETRCDVQRRANAPGRNEVGQCAVPSGRIECNSASPIYLTLHANCSRTLPRANVLGQGCADRLPAALDRRLAWQPIPVPRLSQCGGLQRGLSRAFANCQRGPPLLAATRDHTLRGRPGLAEARPIHYKRFRANQV